jgi:GDPmannose 4,6-dehydratase
MSRNVALITGITGQDGSYLAEFLLEKGYEVHGLIRRSSTFNTSRIDHIYQDPHVESPKLYLHYGDLIDGVGLTNLIREAIRSAGINTRFYQASTSELFGSTPPPQNEESLFKPRSPYAAAKLMAYWCTVNYREGYGMHATNGILFNHESPRRGETFVTRKITRAVAEIANGSSEKLFLGNLDAIRDWGYAKEYVESMWLMLQQDKPSDYVVATGVGATVRDFTKVAFERVGLNWENHVSFDQKYIRPTEVDALIGDPSKAIQQLGWKATTHWKELAELMVDSDLERKSS